MDVSSTDNPLTEVWEKLDCEPRERTVQILARMAHKLFVFQAEQHPEAENPEMIINEKVTGNYD